MAEFAQALNEALGSRYSFGAAEKLRPKRPVTHGQGRQTYMRRMEKKLGGRKAAAAAAGIPYSTWGHMMKGIRGVSARNLAKLVGAFESAVILPAKLAAVAAAGYPGMFAIRAVVVFDPNGTRYINGYGNTADRSPAAVYNDRALPSYRWFNALDLTSDEIKDVVDNWTTGGDAAEVLLDHISTHYTEVGFEGPHVQVAFEEHHGDDDA